MKASVERLRWGLVAAAVVLLLVLAGYLGYGRYRQLKKWQAVLAKLHLNGPHETTDFTYSSSPKDRTSYKVHAAKVIEHGDGKWSLYDVAATVYSKTDNNEEHLAASDVEYDQKTGVASAVGQVHIELQVPRGLEKGKAVGTPAHAAGNVKNTIEVVTSGLVYVHKLGIAATSEAVEFRYAGMECTSQGAEFDPGQSVLHLLANVVMVGTLRDAPFTLHAVKADLDRQANTVAMVKPVAVSDGKTVSAGFAVLDLREDGSLQGAEGSGGVSFAEGTRRMVAADYSGTFGDTSLPLTAKLSGGVVATDSDAARPVRMQAKVVDAVFDAAGAPEKVVATGGARMMLTERKQGEPDLPRELQGDRVVATFVKDGGRKSKPQLREVDATGGAMVRGVSVAAAKGKTHDGLTTTQMNADTLRAMFVEDALRKPELRQVFGNGHARLEQDAPMGSRQVSSSDALTIAFAPEVAKKGAQPSLQIVSAVQRGGVTIHSVPTLKPGKAAEPPSDATAAVASYDGATDMLTLSGGVSFAQGETSLRADTIAVNQRTEDATAAGAVMASLRNASSGKGGAASEKEAQVTHIAAERATLLHASGVSEFYGTAARPARLWQGASQVQAQTLLLDQQKKTVLARTAAGMQVHAVFANDANAGVKDAGRVVRVASSTMQYDDAHREAVFLGGVRMDGGSSQAQSQRATVFLNPAKAGSAASVSPFGGSLQRIVLSDHVRVEQPGRTGVGEQLVYTPTPKDGAAKGGAAPDGTFVLTGAPGGKLPHIVDAQQGSVTGAMLVFHGGDSTIIVTGATPRDKRERVRTEVEVRGK
jgi:lipopolysaccharide export system protein LptA